MKLNNLKKPFIYYFPVTLTLFMLVTLKRNLDPIDGGYSALWGFPFAYISDAIACSFCYDVFVGPLILDLVFYLGAVFLLFKIIEKAGIKLGTHWFLLIIGLLVCVFWIFIFYAGNTDSIFHFKNDTPYKIVSEQFNSGLY